MTNPDVPQPRDEPKLTLIRSISDAERMLLMARRQAIIIELGSIEDYLGMDRSIIPKRKREELRRGA